MTQYVPPTNSGTALITYNIEVMRIYAVLYVTDIGVFRKMPESAASVLEVETVYRVVLTDASGRIIVQDFANPVTKTESYNADTKEYEYVTGGPIDLYVSESVTLPWWHETIDKGGSTSAPDPEPLLCYKRTSPHVTQAAIDAADMAYSMGLTQKDFGPFAPA